MEIMTSSSGRRRSTVSPDADADAIISTEARSPRFSFVWKIQNFSAVMEDGHELRSPPFQDLGRTGHSWKLRVTPKANFNGVDYVSVSIVLVSLGGAAHNHVNANYELFIEDADGEPHLKVARGEFRFFKMTECGTDKFIECSRLTSKALPGDIFCLHCIIWTEEEMTQNHTYLKTPGMGEMQALALPGQLPGVIGSKLHADIRKALWDPALADMYVILDGQRVPAHKILLSVRVPMLKGILENTSGMQGTCLEFPDFPAVVVRGLLEYVYTDCVSPKVLENFGPNLLEIAEVYGVSGLKDLCQNIMLSRVNVNNAALVLMAAYATNAATLRDYTTRFINAHKAAVIKTPGFLTLCEQLPQLCADLYLCV